MFSLSLPPPLLSTLPPASARSVKPRPLGIIIRPDAVPRSQHTHAYKACPWGWIFISPLQKHWEVDGTGSIVSILQIGKQAQRWDAWPGS